MPSGSLPGPVYGGVARATYEGGSAGPGATGRSPGSSRGAGLLPYQRKAGAGRSWPRRRPLARLAFARSGWPDMEDGGVTFVKLGQVLSTRRDLLPAEFISELSRLQDDAVGVPWPAIEQVLRSELGAEVDEQFASFDRQPIAAASIAQVHAATLLSGARVVVKVRRPEVSETVARETWISPSFGLRRTGWSAARTGAGSVGAAGLAAEVRQRSARGTRPPCGVEARNMTAVAAAVGRRRSASPFQVALPAAMHRPGAGDGAPGRAAPGRHRRRHARRQARRAGPQPAGLPAPPGHA